MPRRLAGYRQQHVCQVGGVIQATRHEAACHPVGIGLHVDVADAGGSIRQLLGGGDDLAGSGIQDAGQHDMAMASHGYRQLRIFQPNVVPLSKDQALVTVLRTTADLVEDTQAIKIEQHELRKELSLINEKVDEQITLTSGEQRAVQKEVAKKVYEIESDTTVRPNLFRELHREIKDRFAVASYKDVRRQELQTVINYVRSWVPRKVS